jgi:HEAT repeat protein
MSRAKKMRDLLNVIEERTRAWDALSRQTLADHVWADYVSVRFRRTGDPRALQYLYPYLNHADRRTRLRAIDVAGRVFEGRGPAALDHLDYFTKNTDLFILDRAVLVVGAAIAGSREEVILTSLAPYLNHRNQFIRKLALKSLGKAARGLASEAALAEILRVAKTTGPRPDEVAMAIASVFSGRPAEETYCLVARVDTGDAEPVAVLVRGASDEWYERACKEIFEPLLHLREAQERWMLVITHRDGIEALARAAPGRGMEALSRVLHLRGERASGHAMLRAAQEFFVGADPQGNRGPLVELARTGDIHAQRVAAVCLGRLMMGLEDADSIAALRRLCDARSKAVQSSALVGLGMAAKSTCDESLRGLCLERSKDPETAVAALQALGMIFLGSGRSEIFREIRLEADRRRAEPVRSRHYSRPLAACYAATGRIYLGTGSTEPLDFLLDVLALPHNPWTAEYQWMAAEALNMIEFPESALGAEYYLALPRSPLEAHGFMAFD